MRECRDNFKQIIKVSVAIAIVLVVGLIVHNIKMGRIRESADRLTAGSLVRDELEARGYQVKSVNVNYIYNEKGFTAGLHQYAFTVTYKDRSVETWRYMGYEDINEDNVDEIKLDIGGEYITEEK